MKHFWTDPEWAVLGVRQQLEGSFSPINSAGCPLWGCVSFCCWDFWCSGGLQGSDHLIQTQPQTCRHLRCGGGWILNSSSAFALTLALYKASISVCTIKQQNEAKPCFITEYQVTSWWSCSQHILPLGQGRDISLYPVTSPGHTCKCCVANLRSHAWLLPFPCIQMLLTDVLADWVLVPRHRERELGLHRSC